MSYNFKFSHNLYVSIKVINIIFHIIPRRLNNIPYYDIMMVTLLNYLGEPGQVLKLNESRAEKEGPPLMAQTAELNPWSFK